MTEDGSKGRDSKNPPSVKVRSHFRISRCIEPIYTGSQMKLSPDSRFLLCSCEDLGIKIVDATSLNVTGTLKQEEETFTSFCPFRRIESSEQANDELEHFEVITASHNQLLRRWRIVISRTLDFESNESSSLTVNFSLIRSWKAQTATPAGRICSLETDETQTILASGATDGSIRIWDLSNKTCTHFLRGHTGVVSLLRFYFKDTQQLLITSAVGDAQLRAWDLSTGSNPTFVELNGHTSVVTDVVFSPSGMQMVTVSRDQVIVVWDAVKLTKIKTWPCYEQVESAFVCHILKKSANNSCFHVATAGTRGELRIWDIQNGRCIAGSPKVSGNCHVKTDIDGDTKADSIGFLSAILYGMDTIICTTSDRRLVFYNIVEDDDQLLIEEKCQVPCDVGEVLDVVSIQTESSSIGLLAVATTNPLVRVYNPKSWSCVFLEGHSAAVTSLATFVHGSNSLVLSASRDKTLIMWNVNLSEGGRVLYKAVAKASGHTAAVLAVATLNTGEFFVSGGADQTVKLWQIPKKVSNNESPTALRCSATVKGHDKDINSLALSPNGRFMATGSQDKTAKIWLVESDHAGVAALQLMGVLRGHRRAIWSVEFSPIDQILSSASADGTVKLWALSNLSCLRTFEGHEVAVLRSRFVNKGSQLVSAAADGVVRVWSLQTGDSIAVLENGHEDRTWAVTPVNDGEWLVTGSADDRLVVWHDYTAEYVEEYTRQEQVKALHSQQLENLIANENFTQAFELALSLNQPARLFKIVSKIRMSSLSHSDSSAEPGVSSSLVASIVSNLNDGLVAQLLRILTAWNTNTKYYLEAQHVLSTLLKARPIGDLIKIIKNDTPTSKQQLLRDSIEALMAYTQRHFARVDRLTTQSAFVDFAWNQLKLLDEEMAIPQKR